MKALPEQALAAWIQYLRDMGVYDLYRQESPRVSVSAEVLERFRARGLRAEDGTAASAVDLAGRSGEQPHRPQSQPPARRVIPGTQGSPPRPRQPVLPAQPELRQPLRTSSPVKAEGPRALPPELAAPMPKPNPLEDLFSAPAPLAAGEKAEELHALQTFIGDCTRCPLAYAGRHTVVFGEGDPNATLMFIGEGPGADEDASGRPFVGKAGQLLNNMISAMGLQREQVFIANVVKCRPPGNRAPEYVEATTCSQFLLQQIDIVRPAVIVALGATAATYVLGVRQSLASLRGKWHQCRDAKVAVTFHPAFLLRDPRQKSEAWKDLQRVMSELGLKPVKSAPQA